MNKYFLGKFPLLSAALVLFLAICECGAVSITSLQTLDTAGNPRTNFSNTESITFRIECLMETESDKTEFKFTVNDPSGMQVFYHEGNSTVGRTGMGGTELRNIPITFFTGPGNYVFKGEVITKNQMGVALQDVTRQVIFTLYSANISLTYPVNGARDLLAQPMIFRWVATGATKYRIYIDDDPSFYNVMFKTGEGSFYPDVFTTEFQYPQNPEDTKQRLASGTIYYWKVEGLDASDKVVARTPFPFNFTIKDTTVISRDLSLENITISSFEPETGYIRLDVWVKNYGNEAFSNVTVNLNSTGASSIPSKILTVIQPNETKVVQFEFLLGSLTGDSITSTAYLSIDDDNPRNNSLTKILKISLEKAKILGGVTEKNSQGQKPVKGAVITYKGPANGSAEADNGGQYKIEKLPLGDYELTAKAENYNASDTRALSITKFKAYPNIDFELAPVETARETEKKKEEKKIKEYSMSETWDTLKNLLPERATNEFEGFGLVEVELVGGGNINELLSSLEDGKAKITKYEVYAQKSK